jgi:hypothetical protein
MCTFETEEVDFWLKFKFLSICFSGWILWIFPFFVSFGMAVSYQATAVLFPYIPQLLSYKEEGFNEVPEDIIWSSYKL